ncbi:MAG: hypothetical protein IPL03_16435 [Sterolibacteriaceae bacterium]|nr:hypothetical protein [Candidatus Methylophosphatis haderslevensis]
MQGMYLRDTTRRTRTARRTSPWRLVRSVRRGRKVIQETVAQLGELDAEAERERHFLRERYLRASERAHKSAVR